MIDDDKLDEAFSDLRKQIAEEHSARLAYQASTDRMLARVIDDVTTLREVLEKHNERLPT